MVLRAPEVVTAALEICDRYGLADLTMRRVAEQLDVKAGALYWHFPNKQALLAAVSDRVLGELDLPGDDLAWDAWLRAWALGLRRTLLAHRDSAELVSSSLATELATTDLVGVAARRLVAAGVAADDAGRAVRALLHLTPGQVTLEQNRATLVQLGLLDAPDAAVDDADHAAAVDLLLAGLRARSSESHGYRGR